ncbi:hypothetical protein R1sor_011255 [Riccia sorocarpa]|uniref:Uncharacterized protein n=1 Tax=Riccia sorocarpa TaxID=122646 RepID=A0ABD3I272_9MARC
MKERRPVTESSHHWVKSHNNVSQTLEPGEEKTREKKKKKSLRLLLSPSCEAWAAASGLALVPLGSLLSNFSPLCDITKANEGKARRRRRRCDFAIMDISSGRMQKGTGRLCNGMRILGFGWGLEMGRENNLS